VSFLKLLNALAPIHFTSRKSVTSKIFRIDNGILNGMRVSKQVKNKARKKFLLNMKPIHHLAGTPDKLFLVLREILQR